MRPSQLLGTVAFISVQLCASALFAEERYLCTSKATGGVAYSDMTGEWEGTKFISNSETFIVTDTYEGDDLDANASFYIIRVGQDFASGYCEEGFGTTDVLRCNRFGPFYLNRRTLRFMDFYAFGYIDGVDDKANTPSVAIGECARY